MVFRDKKTRYGHVEFYRNFGDQREAFKKGILYLRTLRSFDHKKGKFDVMVVETDQATPLTSAEAISMFTDINVRVKFTSTEHHQNSDAETLVRELYKDARILMYNMIFNPDVNLNEHTILKFNGLLEI